MVFVQGLMAWTDGFLTRGQLRARSITGWCLLEHGGIWADIFVISPLAAYVLAKYQVHWFSFGGLITLVLAVGCSLAAMTGWREGGSTTPEAHTHDGRTTAAGWIHGIYMVVGIAVFVQFFFANTTPAPATKELLVVAWILTPFFPLGVVKFSPKYRFDVAAYCVTFGGIALTWIATLVRIHML